MKVMIRSGDSFWYYSQLFKIPLKLIIDSNRSLSPATLQIGQPIHIPGYTLNSYKIKQGDSFWTIANRLKTPIDTLSLLNQNVNSIQLKVGQTIMVPRRVTRPIVNSNQKYDYQTMISDLKRLAEIYPFIRKASIGQTPLENTIPEIRVGIGTKKVHVNGSFHANEWITTPVLMTFLNDYLLSLTNTDPIRGLAMSSFYQITELSMVPMVNPDGVNLVLNGLPKQEPYRSSVIEINNGSLDFSNWKANIRGVDLNNQFPAKWEIEKERKPDQPAPRDYPGPKPLSEPEALAMANLTKKRSFDRTLAFHTQGEVIYWGFENQEPPIAETIVEEFARVSGYEPIHTVDSYAGYKDWFIQDWKRPGYTLELGSGVNPLPLSQFPKIYQESLGILLASLYM